MKNPVAVYLFILFITSIFCLLGTEGPAEAAFPMLTDGMEISPISKSTNTTAFVVTRGAGNIAETGECGVNVTATDLVKTDVVKTGLRGVNVVELNTTAVGPYLNSLIGAVVPLDYSIGYSGHDLYVDVSLLFGSVAGYMRYSGIMAWHGSSFVGLAALWALFPTIRRLAVVAQGIASGLYNIEGIINDIAYHMDIPVKDLTKLWFIVLAVTTNQAYQNGALSVIAKEMSSVAWLYALFVYGEEFVRQCEQQWYGEQKTPVY